MFEIVFSCWRFIVRLNEWCFTLLSTLFQSYHNHRSHYSCLSWVSTVLRWSSKVSCPRTFPQKNPEDQVRLEPRTPRLQFKHFTTELHVFPVSKVKLWGTKDVELCKGYDPSGEVILSKFSG